MTLDEYMGELRSAIAAGVRDERMMFLEGYELFQSEEVQAYVLGLGREAIGGDPVWWHRWRGEEKAIVRWGDGVFSKLEIPARLPDTPRLSDEKMSLLGLFYSWDELDNDMLGRIFDAQEISSSPGEASELRGVWDVTIDGARFWIEFQDHDGVYVEAWENVSGERYAPIQELEDMRRRPESLFRDFMLDLMTYRPSFPRHEHHTAAFHVEPNPPQVPDPEMERLAARIVQDPESVCIESLNLNTGWAAYVLEERMYEVFYYHGLNSWIVRGPVEELDDV